jgi:hypothetical protein
VRATNAFIIRGDALIPAQCKSRDDCVYVIVWGNHMVLFEEELC